jgi:hypothetical protein
MKTVGKSWLLALLLLMIADHVHADVHPSRWLQLDADSKERLRHLIQSDVESRRGFSTSEEDRINTSLVEQERQKENSAYKAAIEAANSEFHRTKKRMDDLSAQFQTASYDFEETHKNVDNIKAGIENIDNSIGRYRADIRSQQEALTKWLKTSKQGEAVVAVIYTRGFMDSAHKLERRADEASAPLMVEHMGTYIQSFTKVINNVLTGDFIRAVEEGTAKWNREEPVRIALVKGSQGTTYLRVKRYELYPFQAPENGGVKSVAAPHDIQAVIITAMKDLEAFLKQNNYSPGNFDLGRVKGMINDANLANQQAEANQREQLISFRERINYLDQKIVSAGSDRESLVKILNDKQAQLSKMTTELEVLRLKKESAELAFQNAQTNLFEKKRVHESIIIKTSLITIKRSETPAEASAEAVLDELADVLNDARMQHYTSTTDVANGKLVDESDRQAITEAKIIAVRSLAFLNEGDSIRVKMAFRVRTVLDAEEDSGSPPRVAATPRPVVPAPQPVKKEIETKTPATQKPKAPPVQKKRPLLSFFKKQTAPAPAIEPTPTPSIESPRSQSAEAMGFRFTLTKVMRSGSDLTFFLESTNRAAYVQYLAFYDESSSYARSTVSANPGSERVVNQVYLHQGGRKIPASQAYRGIPVDPNTSVAVELIFKGAAPANAFISQLDLLPSVGTRSIIHTYSWRSQHVPFKNISVPR